LNSNYTYPRLNALIDRAIAQSRRQPRKIGLVYPCDGLALEAAARIAELGIAQPVLIGPPGRIAQAAQSLDSRVNFRLDRFELCASADSAPQAAQRATELVHEGGLHALMKGSLHTDELMSAIVDKVTGLRGNRRISHVFIFDLPRYHKLLALADCVVNIAPNLAAKQDILSNAIELLPKIVRSQDLGANTALNTAPIKVAIVTAIETVNAAIPASVDAQSLVRLGVNGGWPGSVIEGPFGFDNAFSAEAARIKKMDSVVAGDADLMLMPDLNAGNMLYKSFNYVGGGDCAGIVLGAKVPIVLTSRADSLTARLASVALAVLAFSAAERKVGS
jgi:phosphate acetyltransferase